MAFQCRVELELVTLAQTFFRILAWKRLARLSHHWCKNKNKTNSVWLTQDLQFRVTFEIWFNIGSFTKSLIDNPTFFFIIKDTTWNKVEFPRRFHRGALAFEGYWWAFVTMSTVGEENPKIDHPINNWSKVCLVCLVVTIEETGFSSCSKS